MARKKFGTLDTENFIVPGGTSNLAVVDAVVQDGERYHIEIDFRFLLPNPRQPRKVFHEQSIVELASSIAENGLIEEIVVRKSTQQDDFYEIICGERRVRACRDTLHWEKIPATVLTSCNDRQMLQIAIIENDQREQVSPYDLALGYKELYESVDDEGQRMYTIRSLAKALGKDKSVVQDLIDLTKAAPEALQLILDDPTTPIRIVNEISDVPETEDRLHLAEGVRIRRWKTDDIIAIVKTLKKQRPDTLSMQHFSSSATAVTPDKNGETEKRTPPPPTREETSSSSHHQPSAIATVAEHDRIVRPSEQLAYAERLRTLAKQALVIEKIVRTHREEISTMPMNERESVHENVRHWIEELETLLL